MSNNNAIDQTIERLNETKSRVLTGDTEQAVVAFIKDGNTVRTYVSGTGENVLKTIASGLHQQLPEELVDELMNSIKNEIYPEAN